MGSKGRMPPPHMRSPLPGPGLLPPETLGPGMHPLLSPFPLFDLLAPPEVMEQKLAAQHVEMQRLDTENQRLAATHGASRQELAAAQHELQMLHAQIGAVKAEREHQMWSIVGKIAKMEAELQAAEPLKLELNQARAEAQNLVVSREELVSRAQQLTQDLHRTHANVQQIPTLMSELESLRQEYQHCRETFGYEKQLYNDHLESLKVMEKNYVSMAREVEKLRAELMNTTNVDQGSSVPYVGTLGSNKNETSGLPVGQNAYEDGYAASQGRGPLRTASGGDATTSAAEAQPGPAAARPGYDAQRPVMYDAHRLTGYDAVKVSAYDSQRGVIFDVQRTNYDVQRGLDYDMQRAPAYNASGAGGYDVQSRGAAGPHGHAPPVNNMPYVFTTPPAGGGGYEAASRGGNPVRR